MNLNFQHIKDTVLTLAFIIALGLIVWMNIDKDEQSSGFTESVENLNMENDTLFNQILILEEELSRKDSIISGLEKQIARTDSKVKHIKSKRDEKINTINTIAPDSLYRLLSGFKY